MNTYIFCTPHGSSSRQTFWYIAGEIVPRYLEIIGYHKGETPEDAYASWFKSWSGRDILVAALANTRELIISGT